MIDIALFGLGRIGLMHGKNLMRNKDFNLKYVYDTNKNLAFKASKILKSNSIRNPLIAFKDKTIDEASTIQNTEIVKELSLPPVKIHCSVLAEDAIKAAIKDYKEKNARD